MNQLSVLSEEISMCLSGEVCFTITDLAWVKDLYNCLWKLSLPDPPMELGAVLMAIYKSVERLFCIMAAGVEKLMVRDEQMVKVDWAYGC